MGWCSGSEVYDRVINAALKAIPDKGTRREFHTTVITAFEDRDWDCQQDCLGQDEAFDEALAWLHPEWNEEED